MEKHYLLVAFLLILAGWLPYILIFCQEVFPMMASGS